MARFTVSPQGLGSIMEAFAAGPQQRANAEAATIANTLAKMHGDQDAERFAAQKSAQKYALTSNYGLNSDEADDVIAYNQGQRQRETGQFGADGTPVMRDIVMPLRLKQAVASRQLGDIFRTYGDAFAYSPGGAGQIQQTIGLAGQNRAAQEAAAQQSVLSQELMNNLKKGDINGVNIVNAAKNGHFYTPNAAAEGMVYNRANGNYIMTPVGTARVDELGTASDLRRAQTVAEVVGLDRTKAEIARLQALAASENYKREHGLLGRDGRGTGNPLYKLSDKEIERRYTDVKGNFDNERYNADLQEAAYKGVSLADYLYEKDAEKYKSRKIGDDFARSLGYPVGADMSDKRNRAAAERYYRNVDALVEEWAGGKENVAQSKLPQGFDVLNKKQQAEMLIGLKNEGKLSQEEARILFRRYQLVD